MNTLEAPTCTAHESIAIEDLQANGHSSPALRLLPEILAIIFFFHAEANPTNPEENGIIIPKGMTPAQFKLGWITVTHVCRLWRLVALDYRNLWTHHRFKLGLEWTMEMLRRAGDAPLDLKLSEAVVPFPPSEDRAECVIPLLLSRASALTIEEGACTHVVLNTLTRPAPLLSSLTINSGRFDVLPRFLFGDIAPKLHHLSLRNALPTWSAVALTHLKTLSIAIDRHTDTSTNITSYADLLDALQAMPNLESLMLISCLPLGPFPHCLEDKKVQIPKLRNLLLSDHVQGFCRMLEHLSFPRETIVWGSCITDDMTGKECCDVLPLLLSYLPRPSLETLDVSWGHRFDRNFNIRGYSTSHEEENSGKPCFFLEADPCFSIEFQFKFLLWSAEQKLRILKTVCSALPTDELRVLSGNLDLGKDAWPEIFGGHMELRHIRICSLSTLDSLIPFLGREEVYPKLVSLTLRDMDLLSKQGAAVSLLINRLKTGKPPKMSKIFIETCRIKRATVDSMRAAVPGIEIQWDEVQLPGWFHTGTGITRRL
ncbi:hypothetical protein BC827DRAFT_1360324 [Russula dissimulans]|nr:hypothetical protein BC827DRAFT_1360324 [Russula dissimulans]